MSVEQTKVNKARRQAKHEKRYPQKSTRSFIERRAMSKAWKEEEARRNGVR